MEHYTTEACASHLQGMVRIPTVSHPDCADMDFDRFRELHAYLEKTYPLVHSTLKKEVLGRGALLYHWQGTGKSGKEPLLLMAHQDVVPEGDVSAWKYPPYAGEIAEGKLWGRGTTDSKCNIMAHMEALEYLIGTGFVPDYDLYLAYGYNEEVMGGPEPAAKLIADTLQARGIRIGMVIDECGGLSDGKHSGLDCPVCEIIVSEKGYADYEFIATNKGGHSCMPDTTGALTLIAQTILALEANWMPTRAIPAVKNYLQAVAPHMADESAKLLEDIDGNWAALQDVIAGNRNLSALFRSTTAITMASGSAQANILPEKATLTVNCRFLEGDTVESMLEYYRSIVPEGVEVRLIKGNNLCHTSPMDACYHLLEDVTHEMYPGMLCVPGYLLGGTDSRYYTVVSDHVYRYGSFYGNDEYGPAHSVNEAIPLSVLTGGPTFFEKLLLRYGR